MNDVQSIVIIVLAIILTIITCTQMWYRALEKRWKALAIWSTVLAVTWYVVYLTFYYLLIAR